MTELQKQFDAAAIADYKNDLESMTDREVEQEMNKISDEINELESWFDALIAWQRRNM